LITIKTANLDKKSLNTVKKASPFYKLWAITTVLGVAMIGLSCGEKPADETSAVPQEPKSVETPAVAQETKSAAAAKEVCLYEHSNYNGWEKCYPSDQPNFVTLRINDTVSSLKVKGGATAELFEHTDYNGFKREYSQDTPWVGNEDNDKFSSLKIK
jgi:Peptidase inhibitor family I36